MIDGSPKYHFPVETHHLPNGLRVLLMERPHLPILSFTVLIDAGVISEGPDEPGLSGFALGLFPRGTARRDAEHLAEDVDSLGAALGVHADYDFCLAGLACLARDQAEALEILGEVVTAPAFLPDEVERRRHDVLSTLERLKDEPSERVRNAFLKQLYGGHPYHHPAAGTTESVGRFQTEGIRDFYHRLYRPNNAILAVVGDLDPAATLRMVEERFGAWPRAEIVRPQLPPIAVAERVTVQRIHKPGVTQATLRMGCLGIRRDSPDYVPLVFANYILGGSGFGSRLMKSLREESGLTYGAYSSFHPRREPGYFFASCQTSLATMNESLQKMFEEVRRLREDGVTAQELDWAQRYFSGSLPLSLQTNDQLATRVLEQEFYGLEKEFWLKDAERMERTTLAEVNAAARRYFDTDHLAVVCLADFDQVELETELG